MLVQQLTFLVVKQLLNPIPSSSHVSRKSLEEAEVTHILFRIWLLNFHANNSRDTISWECFVKNDSVRSCLIELQSFHLSKFDVDPTHRVLMFLACFMDVPCKRRCSQVDRLRIPMVFVHGIHRQKEYCLSDAQMLTSWYQS